MSHNNISKKDKNIKDIFTLSEREGKFIKYKNEWLKVINETDKIYYCSHFLNRLERLAIRNKDLV
jgi:hypothetical protein